MINKILEYDDLWTKLQHSNKPIILYGMGDGADKVINACEHKGIKISGVFASDGFVKNKQFHSFTVTDYATAKANFKEFIVLLSFASSRPEVIENIMKIASENELYCPDVPVFGEGLFDKEFVTKNFEKFEAVYNKLSDNTSKQNYINIILGKLTGDISFLMSAETTVKEAYDCIIQPNKDSVYVDIGAYNGDTIREYLSYSGGYTKIYAFEPDIKNYKKLCLYAQENNIDTSSFHNIAAWDKEETLTFFSRSGRNSAKTTSHKFEKSIDIKADTADNYIDTQVDFINIDAEGSDKNVIFGLTKTIEYSKPCISCAVYHRNEDMFEIPLLLTKLYGKCELFLRHFRYFPAWDTNIYIKHSQN